MPTEQNGVLTYAEGEKEIPEDLRGVTFSGIHFVDGIKQVEIDGRKTWVPATREDRLNAETRRLGRAPNPSKFLDSCGLINPTTCGGQCTAAFCARRYDGVGKVYYCICTKFPET